MQRTWRRTLGCFGLATALTLSTGCKHFHPGTFFTTNPLYYSDLVPGNAEGWEQGVWQDAQSEMKRRYPKKMFGPGALCEKRPAEMTKPETHGLHAFNFGKNKALYNSANDVILYPIGDIEILFHEYVHAMDAQWSDECRAEMRAIDLTRDWVKRRGKPKPRPRPEQPLLR